MTHPLSLPARTRLAMLLALTAVLLLGCVTVPESTYQPPANPHAHRYWHYQLVIDPPLPADQVRVDVLYRARKPTCPVSQVGLRLNPQQRGTVLVFDVLMDQFRDPQCDWQANQIWIALGKQNGGHARFSLPVGSTPQVRWCRLNPRHGACLARESEAKAFNVPGTVHEVMVLQRQ